MRRFFLSGYVLCMLGWQAAAAAPLPIKVVIVAMFEAGEDTGDRPGEFEYWVEREKLTKQLPFDGGVRKLRINADESVLGVVTGAGVTNATATIMALGMDARFDFSKAYWIIAGIAGVDPEDASLGSAAWANFVVDGDLCFEVDAREMPADWPYGRLSSGAKAPGILGRRGIVDNIVYQLNPKLVEWAYRMTKDIKLMDTPEMAEERAAYKGYPKAQLPPFVFKGDSLGSSTYWHGWRLNKWANDWVKMYTEGAGNFAMTNMEDNGTAMALKRLTALAKADFQRVLFLRTASNFSTPPPGLSAETSLSRPHTAGLPSLDAAHRVGSAVLHELVKNWSKYKNQTPGE